MRRINTVRQAVNAALNHAEYFLQRPVLRSLPQNVDVVLTKACNLACRFCIDYETLGAKRISLENFEKIARQLFPTARRLSICSGGEPYLHKGLEDILRVAKRYKLDTWVLSNGMLLKEDRIRTICREGLIDLHGFSCDGFKPETVEAIRVNAQLATILENIRMVIRVREEEGRRAPGIVARYALMRSNIEELPDTVERWGAMGVDRLDTSYLGVCNGIDRNESLYFHQDLMIRVFAEARKVAARFPRLTVNLPQTVAEALERKKKPTNCKAPWGFVKIDTDGRVLPCYRAWDALDMGKVYDDDGVPFDRIWNDERYQALRRTVNDDGVEKHFPYCARCEYRYGWGDLEQHVGYEEWSDTVAPLIAERDKRDKDVDHRRDKRAAARG